MAETDRRSGKSRTGSRVHSFPGTFALKQTGTRDGYSLCTVQTLPLLWKGGGGGLFTKAKWRTRETSARRARVTHAQDQFAR